MPVEFHLLRAEWLMALPAVLLLAFALSRQQLAPGSWHRIVSPALAPYVLSSKPLTGLAYRWWLLAAGGTIVILSLAGPSFSRVEQPVFRSEQAIVIALDLSRSMDAQDLSPSRLTRARLKILDILEHRQSGQTALVVYSSNAFTVTPLTTDTDTVAALVNSLSTDIMPSRGSYPVAAINKGGQLLQQAGVRFGEVLLISDGGTSPAAEAAARQLTDSGYSLSVLGVGTEEGAPIPRAGGGFVTDRSGNIAVPKLEKNALRRLAAAGRGRYVTMTTGNADIELLLSGGIESSSEASQSLETDQWREDGPWLLLLLLPLAALAFRRGLVVCLLIFVLPSSETAHALTWDDLWLNKDQQGHRKLADGRPEEAARLFADPKWAAVSSYRSGSYALSAAEFAQAFLVGRDAESSYNLGNALAQAGKYEPAIDAYTAALEITPDDEDTLYNLELVRELLARQEQQQNEQQEGQQSDPESGGQSKESESDGESDQQDQEGASGESDGESSDDASRDEQSASQDDMQAMQDELRRAAEEAARNAGEETETETMTQAEAEAMRRAQEQTQALQQWLRRIENDPGGLLRRKFRYQYQRQGRDQDGNSVWPDDEVESW